MYTVNIPLWDIENAEKHKEENNLPVTLPHFPTLSFSLSFFYFAYLCSFLSIFKNAVRISFGNLPFHLALESEYFSLRY